MDIASDLPPPPEAAGFRLDGEETFTIPGDQDSALCASTGIAPQGDGRAHPIWYYIATQLGMGSTVEGICAACDFDLADGPLMAGTSVTFHEWPRVGTPYRVSGEIISLTRKVSRKLGVMDLLEYRLALHEGDRTVLETVNRWALPRKAQ